MSWDLYDYVNLHGQNEFKEWCGALQKQDLAKLNLRLDLLEEKGPDLLPKMLAGPLRGQRHIYKLTINGRVALRPLLCKGPVNNNSEFTLLMGATERDWQYDPRDAPASAEAKRQEVLQDPNTRRCQHDPVFKQNQNIIQ